MVAEDTVIHTYTFLISIDATNNNPSGAAAGSGSNGAVAPGAPTTCGIGASTYVFTTTFGYGAPGGVCG